MMVINSSELWMFENVAFKLKYDLSNLQFLSVLYQAHISFVAITCFLCFLTSHSFLSSNRKLRARHVNDVTLTTHLKF